MHMTSSQNEGGEEEAFFVEFWTNICQHNFGIIVLALGKCHVGFKELD